MGCVELLTTLPDGELWVRVYLIQNAAKGAEGTTRFESRDYPLVEQLQDHLHIQGSHLQVPRVARSVVEEQENLERKVFSTMYLST